MDGSQRVGNLTGLLADLSLRADEGDDEASCQLNQLAERYPADMLLEARRLAEVRRKPSVLIGLLNAMNTEKAAAAPEAANPWDVIGYAVDIIAAHYRLPVNGVWKVVLDLEAELRESHGTPTFARLLEQPLGFAVLGLRVAHIMLGVEESDQYSLIDLGSQ